MSEGADQKPSLTSLQAVNTITKPYRARIAFFSLCTFGVGLLEAFFLVVVTRTGLAIANGQAVVGVTRGVELTVSETALAGLGVLAVRFALYYATARVQTGLQYRITAGYRRQLGFSFLGTSWVAQSQQPPGFLQQVLVQFPSHIAGVVSLLASAISAGLGLVALLGIALVINVASTLLVLAALVVLALILLPIARSVRRKSTTSVEHQATFANNVAEVSNLGLEINAFGVRSRVRDKLAELIDNEVAATRHVTLTSSLVSPIYMTLAYGAVLLALIALDSVGAEDINQVGAVMLIMMRSLSYGQQFQNNLTGVAASAPYAQTILQTAASFASETREENSIAISSIDSLAFEKVGFSYPNRPPTLTDATFSIDRGEIIGVVGPSGAGKTTLIQLLLDLLPPSHGNITVNGRKLESIDRRDWSRLACYVPQEPKLITGTIADNVRFFRPKVSNSDVAWALARANLQLDPDRFPDGIHTDLGVAGRQLSGGQRQRIVIARALASHPSLLILDEPTSALDAESEEIVSETLRNLKGEVTVVVVSHRATTLQICDRVLIVEQGLVREQSTRP